MTITLDIIPSAEAFGMAFVDARPPVPTEPVVATSQITAVAGWYAVGPPKIVTTTIASKEAFAVMVFAYSQTVLPATIASAEAFRAITVGRGAVPIVIAAAISSAESFGAITVERPERIVQGATIASAETFYTPTVTTGPTAVAVPTIASAETFYTATLAQSVSVLFDAVGAGGTLGGGNAVNLSHTATPGAEVLVWVLYTNTAGVGSIAANYAGQAMKLEANYYIGYVAAYTWLACFSYPAALAGAQTVALSFGYSSNVLANSVSYRNANQSDTVKTNGIGPGTGLSVPNVPSAARHMVANMLSAIQASAPVTAYNQTVRSNINALLTGDAPGATPNVSFSATQNVAGYWGGLAIDMWNASVPIIGAAVPTAVNTIALPPHAIGDLIVIAAVDYNSTTVPSKPAAAGTVPAWVDIDANAGANACSMRTACFKATATNHTSGAWGSATYLSAVVVRGQNASSPIGGHAEAGGIGTTGAAAPAITLAGNDSQLLCFHFAKAVALDAAPAGYKRQGISSDNKFAVSSKNDVTVDGATTVTTAGTSTGWRAAQIEILR